MSEKTSGAKIMFCEPIPERPEVPPHHGWWKKTVENIAKPGTTVDFVGLRGGYRQSTSTYQHSYNAINMAQRAYEAEKKGYEAFIIGCASDMGVKECRALVDIPVIAPTEATVLLASTLGRKFSIVDLQASTRSVIEEAVENAGIIDKLASIRYPSGIGMTAQKAFAMMRGDGLKDLTRILTDEMTKAIEEDEAEATFVCCVPTSASLTMQGIYKINGVPIVDQFSACLKMAELMVDMRRAYGTSVCKNSIYLGPLPGWEDDIPIEFD